MSDAVSFVVNEVLAAVGLVVVLAMAVPLLRLGIWLAPSRRHPLDAVVARTSTALPVLVLGLGVPTVVTWFALKRLQGLIVHANVDVRLRALERALIPDFPWFA